LPPPSQWICDDCNQVIEHHSHGWVEWAVEKTHVDQWREFDFFIIHHKSYSPKNQGICRSAAYRKYSGRRTGPMLLNHSLSTALGKSDEAATWGINAPLEIFESEFVKNEPEWSDFKKRLTMPYYEEVSRFSRRLR